MGFFSSVIFLVRVFFKVFQRCFYNSLNTTNHNSYSLENWFCSFIRFYINVYRLRERVKNPCSGQNESIIVLGLAIRVDVLSYPYFL